MSLALPFPPKEVEERDRERAAARRKRLDTAKAVSAVPSRYRQMTMSTNDDQDGRGKRVPRHHPSANASPHIHTPTDDRGCVIEIHLCGPCPRSSRASRERGEDGAWGARAATAAVTAAHSSRERHKESQRQVARAADSRGCAWSPSVASSRAHPNGTAPRRKAG